MMFRSTVVVLLFVSAACRSAAPLPAPTAAPAAPTAAVAIPDAIRWVRDAAEYRAATLQAYRLVTSSVEAAAAGRAPGSWAVVLDADETVINNVTYQPAQILLRQRGSIRCHRRQGT